MKVFIFRCPSRPEIYAASRYETGSNLPGGECPRGGWLFFELVDLKTVHSTSKFGIDMEEIRRRVRHEGYHVWDAGARTRGLADSATALAMPALATMSDEPPAMVVPSVVDSPLDYDAAPAVEASPAPMAPATRTFRSKAAPAPMAPAAGASRAKPAPAPMPPAASASRGKAAPAPRHQVVWFDIPVRDIDRAIRFYSAVLGVLLRKEQAGRGMAMAVLPHTGDSIGGCLVQTMDAKPSDGGPLLYLNADGRLDAAIAATTIAGGTVLQPKHSIGEDGYRAIVLDTEGNRIALHSR